MLSCRKHIDGSQEVKAGSSCLLVAVSDTRCLPLSAQAELILLLPHEAAVVLGAECRGLGFLSQVRVSGDWRKK